MFLFVVFVVVMGIIMMNLLVGLAVDDIKEVQDNAQLKKLAAQVSPQSTCSVYQKGGGA